METDYAYEHDLLTTKPPLSEGAITMLLEQHHKYKQEYESMKDDMPDDIMQAAHNALVEIFGCSEDVTAPDMLCVAKAILAERRHCAEIAREHSFPLDIYIWIHATKKEMTDITCFSVANAILPGSAPNLPSGLKKDLKLRKQAGL